MITTTQKILTTYIALTDLMDNHDKHVKALFMLILRELETDSNKVLMDAFVNECISKKHTCYDKLLSLLTTDDTLLDSLYDFSLLL